MGEPSPFPPIPPTGIPGGNHGSESFLTDQVLKSIEDCGYNMTLLNRTSFESMNSSQQLFYLNELYSSLNCSSGTGPPRSTEPPTTSPPVLLVVYFISVMVLGLLVNICVIGTICRVRRLRTITNCFVLSLAFADLLMAAVVVPLKIKELYEHKVKSASPFLDTLFPILGVASLLNLCAVTLDRYFTITNPLTYEARVNSLQVGIIIGAIWIISTMQEMIHFAINGNPEDERLFQVIRFVIVFSIPFICVMFVNTKIYCIARGHARQIRANVPTQTDSSGRSFSRKMKTARVIALLVGTFILTWLPYFIVTVIEQYHEEQTPLLNETSALEIAKIVCACLACSTALFNPLLYGILRKEVRTGIVRGLKCQNVNQSDFDTTTAAEITTRRFETTRK